jgi:hypothetical protein
VNVDVQGASSDRDPSQGLIVIDLVDQASAASTHIGNYTGGVFPTPRKVGPITLTDVSGSLANGDMVIHFKYPGGNGEFVPKDNAFVMP